MKRGKHESINIHFLDEDGLVDYYDTISVNINQLGDRKTILDFIYVESKKRGKIPPYSIPMLCHLNENNISTVVTDHENSHQFMECLRVKSKIPNNYIVLQTLELIPIYFDGVSHKYDFTVEMYDMGRWDLCQIVNSNFGLNVNRKTHLFYFYTKLINPPFMVFEHIKQPVSIARAGERYIHMVPVRERKIGEVIPVGEKKIDEVITLGNVREDSVDLIFDDSDQHTVLKIEPKIFHELGFLEEYVKENGKDRLSSPSSEVFQARKIRYVIEILMVLIDLSEKYHDNIPTFTTEAFKIIDRKFIEGNIRFLSHLLVVSDYINIPILINVLIRYYAKILSTKLYLSEEKFCSFYELDSTPDLSTASLYFDQHLSHIKGYYPCRTNCLIFIAVHSSDQFAIVPSGIITHILEEVFGKYIYSDIVTPSIHQLHLIIRLARNRLEMWTGYYLKPTNHPLHDPVEKERPSIKNWPNGLNDLNTTLDLGSVKELVPYSRCTMAPYPNKTVYVFWNEGKSGILIDIFIGGPNNEFHNLDLGFGIKEIHTTKYAVFLILSTDGKVYEFSRQSEEDFFHPKEVALLSGHHVTTMSHQEFDELIFVITSNNKVLCCHKKHIVDHQLDFKGIPLMLSSSNAQTSLVTSKGFYSIGGQGIDPISKYFHFTILDKMPPVITMYSSLSAAIILTVDGVWVSGINRNDEETMSTPSKTDFGRGRTLIDSQRDVIKSPFHVWKRLTLDSSIITSVSLFNRFIFYTTSEGLYVIVEGRWPELLHRADELDFFSNTDYSRVFSRRTFSDIVRNRNAGGGMEKKSNLGSSSSCYICGGSEGGIVRERITRFRELSYCRKGNCQLFHKMTLLS